MPYCENVSTQWAPRSWRPHLSSVGCIVRTAVVCTRCKVEHLDVLRIDAAAFSSPYECHQTQSSQEMGTNVTLANLKIEWNDGVLLDILVLNHIPDERQILR